MRVVPMGSLGMIFWDPKLIIVNVGFMINTYWHFIMHLGTIVLFRSYMYIRIIPRFFRGYAHTMIMQIGILRTINIKTLIDLVVEFQIDGVPLLNDQYRNCITTVVDIGDKGFSAN